MRLSETLCHRLRNIWAFPQANLLLALFFLALVGIGLATEPLLTTPVTLAIVGLYALGRRNFLLKENERIDAGEEIARSDSVNDLFYGIFPKKESK